MINERLVILLNFSLLTLLLYNLFEKTNKLTEPLESCSKNKNDLVYKQEAKIDEFYSMIFYFSNTTFIFNIRFMMIYLYRIYRSIHRKNIYLKSMSYNILCPIIGIMFYFIINKIIISYDDASNLMSYNLLYIVISQVLYYMMLKQHIDTIQNMNSNIEINILSYVDEIEIDIETKSLELMVS